MPTEIAPAAPKGQRSSTFAEAPTPAGTPSTSLETIGEEPQEVSYNRRTPFVPLDNPLVVRAGELAGFGDGELVLGLLWKGEARAYPARMLRYHHIVNDTLAGRPFLITY